MTEIDKLIGNLKAYINEYITYETPQSSAVNKGMKLLKTVRQMQHKHCCASYISNHKWCELEYWSEIVRLTVHRLKSLNRPRRLKSMCQSYHAFRYEYIGLPTLMFPNGGSSIIKLLTLFFLAVSALIQVLRLQLIDGQVSFWSQVAYLLGAIITIIYYASMGNFDLAFPYIGSTILSSITIWGIFIHNNTPWESL